MFWDILNWQTFARR